MARLIDLLKIIDSNEIILISSDCPKGMFRKGRIVELLLHKHVIGLCVDTAAEKHMLTIRLDDKSSTFLDGYSFEEGM